jgi:hypothetical protein
VNDETVVDAAGIHLGVVAVGVEIDLDLVVALSNSRLISKWQLGGSILY